MLKKKCFKILFSLIVFSLFFSFNVAFAQDKDGGMSGLLETTGESAGYQAREVGETTFAEMVGSIIKIVLNFLGIIFLILMLYGGFLWMTAGGKEEQVKKSKDIIKNALIGLAIILAARIIVEFVLTTAFEVV